MLKFKSSRIFQRSEKLAFTLEVVFSLLLAQLVQYIKFIPVRRLVEEVFPVFIVGSQGSVGRGGIPVGIIPDKGRGL